MSSLRVSAVKINGDRKRYNSISPINRPEMHATDTKDSVSGLQPLELNRELKTIPVKNFHGVKVYTRTSYLKALEEGNLTSDKEHLTVSISRKVDFSKDVAVFGSKKLRDYIITSSDSFQALYLSFILNTTFGKMGLLNGGDREKSLTNIRAVGRTMIPYPSAETVLYCSTLENMIRFLGSIIDRLDDVSNSIKAARSFLANVREYIVMEMIAPEFFGSRDVHILESWKETVNYFSLENMDRINKATPENSLEMTMALFDKCLEFGNPLMQNLNKMKAYISDIRVHFEDLRR